MSKRSPTHVAGRHQGHLDADDTANEDSTDRRHLRAVPCHHSHLVSKANIKRRLRDLTGANRISPTACAEVMRAIERAAKEILAQTSQVYHDEQAARTMQGLTGREPDLTERHVRHALQRCAPSLSATPMPILPLHIGVA